MKKFLMPALVMILLLLVGCSKENNIIKVAVTGSPSMYSEYYEKGIKAAYEDVKAEYKEKGFDIQCDFYDDKDDYNEGEKITDTLVNDNTLTAIIGSQSANICENQAYRTNMADKILICPHQINDSMLTNNDYDNVFALSLSGENIGKVMAEIADNPEIGRCAVCYSGDEISESEMKSFVKNSNADIVDLIKTNELSVNFDKVIYRWRLAGVDTVVFIPYSKDDYSLYYNIKSAMPDIAVISDSTMDDNTELEAHRESFANMYMVDSFLVNWEDWEKDKDDYFSDTWEILGYNSLRMVVDTAVNNNTTNPQKIAEILHKDGYNGKFQDFAFDEQGMFEAKEYTFNLFTKDDAISYVTKVGE